MASFPQNNMNHILTIIFILSDLSPNNLSGLHSVPTISLCYLLIHSLQTNPWHLVTLLLSPGKICTRLPTRLTIYLQIYSPDVFIVDWQKSPVPVSWLFAATASVIQCNNFLQHKNNRRHLRSIARLYLTLDVLIFFRGNMNIYLHFVSFIHTGTYNPSSSQYHGCWCTGDVRSQGISSHDIDLVQPR